jgi:hypothetical protein
MYFFFIRPRRFGKSLTLSMLENYYDINKKDKFESLFGKLYIGENPTPERNSYLILHLNFAMISAGLDNYKKGLDAHCSNKFNTFCSRYAHLLPPQTKEEMNQKEDAVAQLGFLCDKCAEAGLKIYLFIDEYDHFTNQILAHKEHETRYCEQTHGEGYLRHFFDTIKGAAGDSLGRVFVTGVSPVTMDDLTSGFNIGTNYSLSQEFNEMVGADWMMCEAFCLYADRDTFKPYEKCHSTALDAGKLAEELGVKNLILYHTEEKTLANRKENYTREAAENFKGRIFVPDDLEVIEL